MADPVVGPSDVTIRQVFQVDCAVCCAAVEPDGLETINGAFTSRAAALAAKKNHLEEHERGEW